MRLLCHCSKLPLLVALALTCCGAAMADDVSVLRRHHAWARFRPGSWKQVRVVTETLDEQGHVTNSSTAETTTTLEQVSEDGVTLRIEMNCEVDGRKFSAQPQVVKQGFSGELPGQSTTVKTLDPATLVVDGREILCDTEQVEIQDEKEQRVMLIHYSESTFPRVLKTKTATIDRTGRMGEQETTSEVIALAMPHKVLNETKNVAYTKIVQKTPRGTTTTLAIAAPDVPGEEVAHTSKKLDNQGRVVRRSTMELMAYRTEPEEAPRVSTGRPRSRRFRDVNRQAKR